MPLGMNRSGATPYDFWDARFVAPTFYGSAPAVSFHASDARDANVAMPHTLDEHGAAHVLPWQSYDNAAAAGAIVSSAADMAKWLIMQLDDGRIGRTQLLTKATLQETHASQNLHTDVNDIKAFPLDDAPRSYAMGWHRARYRGHVHLAHTGGVIGFPAYMALLPDRDIGVVVLSNGSQLGGAAFNEAISFWIIDRLLGASQRDWSREYMNRVSAVATEAERKEEALSRSRQRDASTSLPLAQYAGDYEDRTLHSGRVTVRVANGGLILSFAGEGAFSGSLEHWHHDVFRLHPNGVPAQLGWQEFPTFVLDPEGKVVAMLAFRSEFRRLPTAPK